jgi:monoterpene epsilon-lactone hydrolase
LAQTGDVAVKKTSKGFGMNKISKKPSVSPAGSETALRVPERRVPPPTTISAQAQAFLASAASVGFSDPPDPADKAAWRAYIANGEQSIAAMMAPGTAANPCDIAAHPVGGATLYEVTPSTRSGRNSDRAIYYLHGGAFIVGAGLTGAHMAQPIACKTGLTAFAIDYRMPPDHPFPVGLEDSVAGYQRLLERFEPGHIAVMGASAGGGLAASLILKLRDLGLPMPAACVLATPEADLTESGDTVVTNAVIDVVLRRPLAPSIALYADGHDLRDPYLSPVFADFSKGFVPTILMSGTRDMFLSNTVRLHRSLCRAGIETELHVWEAMPHGGFFGAPEDLEMLEQTAAFIRKHVGVV